MKALSHSLATSSGGGKREDSAVPLPSSEQLIRDLPSNDSAVRTVSKARYEIRRLLDGKDKHRLLVICGPCGITDPKATLDYAIRLRSLARELGNELLIVMRAYFEKPRTTVGWKGFVYDPDLNLKPDPNKGIKLARKMLLQINSLGLPCATEFLSPALAGFYSDLISYGCIGSRTVESQIHRELASDLPLPMGLKNSMDGAIGTAINAVVAAQASHLIFTTNALGQPIAKQSSGNAHAHLVLRGGHHGPNYESPFIQEALQKGDGDLPQRPIVVDCSHGNSGKDHRKQPPVAANVLDQYLSGQRRIAGVMLESFLEEGNQPFRPGQPSCYGQSIMDACLGWSQTESLLRDLAQRIAS